MGMSASQIRYCMLQARKNDVEYQGQQINQQRTTLATQSAAHNTELLTLTVPTPPSTEQYTTTSYSFSKNGNDCDIKGLVANDDGTYTVNYTTKVVKDVATRGNTFSYTKKNVAEGENKKIYFSGKEYELYDIDEVTDSTAENIHETNIKIIDEEFGYYDVNEEAKQSSTNNDGDYTVTTETKTQNESYNKVYTTTNNDGTTTTYAWRKNADGNDEKLTFKATTDGSYYVYDDSERKFFNRKASKDFYYIEINDGTNTYAYFKKDDIDSNSIAAGQSVNVQNYVVSPQKIDEDRKLHARINWSETGRMTSIVELIDGDGTTTTGKTFSLDIDTTTDNDAYTNAYNEYLYQKDQYNKVMDEINAKLDIIQAQDKELELQLRNLDTQQQAITTEMDAVKSVTDKNIEKSFNVFG